MSNFSSNIGLVSKGQAMEPTVKSTGWITKAQYIWNDSDGKNESVSEALQSIRTALSQKADTSTVATDIANASVVGGFVLVKSISSESDLNIEADATKNVSEVSKISVYASDIHWEDLTAYKETEKILIDGTNGISDAAHTKYILAKGSASSGNYAPILEQVGMAGGGAYIYKISSLAPVNASEHPSGSTFEVDATTSGKGYQKGSAFICDNANGFTVAGTTVETGDIVVFTKDWIIGNPISLSGDNKNITIIQNNIVGAVTKTGLETELNNLGVSSDYKEFYISVDDNNLASVDSFVANLDASSGIVDFDGKEFSFISRSADDSVNENLEAIRSCAGMLLYVGRGTDIFLSFELANQGTDDGCYNFSGSFTAEQGDEKRYGTAVVAIADDMTIGLFLKADVSLSESDIDSACAEAKQSE